MGTNLRRTAALALVAVVAAAAAASASPRAGTDHPDVVVLRVIAKEVSSTSLDLGPTDASQGDQEIFAADLFDGAQKVGTEDGICTLNRRAPDGSTTYHCWGTHVLPGGHLTTRGIITYAAGESVKTDPFPIAITGGTGRYRTARGELTVAEVSEEEYRITYRIAL